MAACLAAPMQTLVATVVLDHATDMPTDLVLTALKLAGRDLRLAAAFSVLAGHLPTTDADMNAVADLLFEFAGSGRIDSAISPDLFAPAFSADLPVTAASPR